MSGEEASAGPMPSRWLVRLEMAAAAGVFLLWSIGQVWRERYWITGLCFFAPSFLVGIFLAAMAAWSWKQRHDRRLSLAVSACALVPLIFVATVENRWRPAEIQRTDTIRLLHWNVFGGKGGWDRLFDLVREEAADISVLSEVTLQIDLPAVASMLGSEYQSLRVRGIAVFARGSLELRREFEIPWGIAGEVVWTGPQGPLSLLVIDLPSSVRLPRGPLLARFREILEEVQPDLVVGDFNTPRRSAGLQQLPGGYRHAYEAVGSGWSATWPLPLPFWAIDQCLFSPRIEPVRYTLTSSPLSDHRCQQFEFRRLPDESEAEAAMP